MIIILNGPPGAGKDTAAEHIADTYNAVHMKFSWPLKRIFDPVFRVGERTALKMVNEGRDTPQPLLFGKTPREVQIAFFEKFLREEFGEMILGHIAIRELQGVKAPTIVFSDGFAWEVEPILLSFGSKNVKLLKIDRPGHEWGDKGDNRIQMSGETYGIEEQVISNEFELDLFHAQIERALDKWQCVRR